MDLSTFDTKKIEEYAEEAKTQWGQTPEYKEYEKKSADWTPGDRKEKYEGLVKVFAEFGKCKESDPASDEAQGMVKRLQTYITENFYLCSEDVLYGLGRMYAAGGEFTENIDLYGGEGTAEFVYKTIKVYCNK